MVKLLQLESELSILRPLMRQREVGSVLEIGYYEGGTTLFFDHVIGMPMGFIVSVDSGTATPCTPVLTKAALHIVIGNSHDTATLEKVRAVMAEARETSFDMLFIDAGHEGDDAYLDYKMFAPLVSNGGLVAFHDINYPDVRRCYSRVLAETQALHVEIMAERSTPDIPFHGIGVIYL